MPVRPETIIALLLSLLMHAGLLRTRGHSIEAAAAPLDTGVLALELSLLPSRPAEPSATAAAQEAAHTPPPPATPEPVPVLDPGPAPQTQATPQAAATPPSPSPPPPRDREPEPEPTPVADPSPGQDGSLQEKGVITEARLSGEIRPIYSRSSRRRGEEGTVTATVTVDPSGRVSHLEIRASSGFTRLDAAVMDALRDATFEPGMRNGTPTVSILSLTFHFELTDAP